MLGWLLLSFAFFFYQPINSGIKLPSLFWVRQALFQTLMIGTFYFNSRWMVPRLLLRQQTSRYVLALAGIIIGILLILGAFENWFNLPELMFRAFHPDGRGVIRRYGWIQPTLFTIVLVLGISTSVAVLQKWQADAELRQALEQARATSELSYLKAQINPHFFFNTLNNIYALTLIDSETARQAIHRLSRMMRYVLYDTHTGTTMLSKELDFVNDYIQLMQLRLTDKVTITVEPPVPLHDMPIAPMILLPFVENAFKHGISALHPSSIYIGIQQRQRQLQIDVRNTRFVDKKPSLDVSNGIGLVNTRRRLDLLYPDRYNLHIDEQTPAGEYHVQLTLDLA
ncbi:histidine kinase [Spirosoma fluminis]